MPASLPLWRPLAAALCALAATAPATAAVYVCSNDSCSAWTLITDAQRLLKSNDTEKTTIAATLSNSSQQSVTNGYNSVADTDLFLKKGLWHKGGDDPFKGYDHVTAYVYKAPNHVTLLKTCHAFSYKKALTGPYFATCA